MHSSTLGFSAASQTVIPPSVIRRSPSISISRAEYSMSGTRTHIQCEHAGLMIGDESPDLVADLLCVGEE